MNAVRRIAAVTVARSDYGGLRPVLRAIAASPALELQVIVGGAHVEPRFGETWRLIEQDGYGCDAVVAMDLTDDSPLGVARSVARGHAIFVEAYGRLSPDLILAFGDRVEMHVAVVAAAPLGIPVAHVHGGELSFGALDDTLRHAITKLSHLHFTSAPAHRDRVIQMGEEPWRVMVSGAPGIDAIMNTAAPSQDELEARLGLTLDNAPLLVTFHPETHALETPAAQAGELLAALDGIDRPIVFTAPNADPGSADIRRMIGDFVETHAKARLVENLDTPGYVGLMRIAAVMLGNSSSGLIEAPSFGLPVVNVGGRQAGRLRGVNVIDTPCDRDAIGSAIVQAVDPDLRARLATLPNPYGDGRAAERIVARLERLESRETLIAKRFHDIRPTESLTAGA